MQCKKSKRATHDFAFEDEHSKTSVHHVELLKRSPPSLIFKLKL